MAGIFCWLNYIYFARFSGRYVAMVTCHLSSWGQDDAWPGESLLNSFTRLDSHCCRVFGGLWLVTLFDHCHWSRASTSLATSPVFCQTLPLFGVNLTEALSLVGHSGSWLSRGRFSLSFYTYVWYIFFFFFFWNSCLQVDTSTSLESLVLHEN